MPIQKLRNFGKYGVITDMPGYDLPPEAWSDANNIRFTANRFEKMGGFIPTLNKPSEDGTPVLFFAQEPETKTSSVLYATGKNLFRIAGNDHQPINATGASYQATPQNPWGVAYLSNILVFNNVLDDPIAWVPGAAPVGATKTVIPLPGWGKPKSVGAGAGIQLEWKAKSIKAYKNYLLALNMSEEYFDENDVRQPLTNLPQRIRWSNIAYVNALPPDWIEDDETKDGGYIDLSDCIGAIVDGRAMRDFFLVYTDRETYIVKYVGGSFVFDVQKLFPDSGLLNPNCVVEFEGGNHFVISGEDIFIHDGSTRQSIATDLVKTRILEDIINIKYEATKVFSYPSRKEIWVCYVDKTSQTGNDDNFALSKAAVWNWKNGTWTFTDLPDIYWLDSIISPNSDVRTWENPQEEDTVTPTEIVLDVPFSSLPVGFPFRVDVLYKPGEGIQQGEDLKWESSDQTVGIVSPADPYDHSTTFTPLSVGLTKIKVSFVDNTGATSADPLLVKEFEVEVTAAGTDAVLIKQASDNPPIPPVPRPDPFDDPENEWDSAYHTAEAWDKKGFSFAARTFVGSSQDTSFYQMDTGTQQVRFKGVLLPDEVNPVVSFIRHDTISMSDEELDLSYHKTWRTIYPMVSGTGTLTFVIGGSNDPYTASQADERKDYVIGKDYKVDCFTNYRFLSLEIRDDGEGSWQMSGLDLDYFLGGKI